MTLALGATTLAGLAYNKYIKHKQYKKYIENLKQTFYKRLQNIAVIVIGTHGIENKSEVNINLIDYRIHQIVTLPNKSFFCWNPESPDDNHIKLGFDIFKKIINNNIKHIFEEDDLITKTCQDMIKELNKKMIGALTEKHFKIVPLYHDDEDVVQPDIPLFLYNDSLNQKIYNKDYNLIENNKRLQKMDDESFSGFYGSINYFNLYDFIFNSNYQIKKIPVREYYYFSTPVENEDEVNFVRKTKSINITLSTVIFDVIHRLNMDNKFFTEELIILDYSCS